MEREVAQGGDSTGLVKLSRSDKRHDLEVVPKLLGLSEKWLIGCLAISGAFEDQTEAVVSGSAARQIWLSSALQSYFRAKRVSCLITLPLRSSMLPLLLH